MEQIAVTIAEAARVLSVGRSSVYRLIHEGKLTRRHILGRAVITAESIKALIEGPTVGGDE